MSPLIYDIDNLYTIQFLQYSRYSTYSSCVSTFAHVLQFVPLEAISDTLFLHQFSSAPALLFSPPFHSTVAPIMSQPHLIFCTIRVIISTSRSITESDCSNWAHNLILWSSDAHLSLKTLEPWWRIYVQNRSSWFWSTFLGSQLDTNILYIQHNSSCSNDSRIPHQNPHCLYLRDIQSRHRQIHQTRQQIRDQKEKQSIPVICLQHRRRGLPINFVFSLFCNRLCVWIFIDCWEEDCFHKAESSDLSGVECRYP